MKQPARRLRLKGEVEHRAEGEAALTEPGDAVIVRRGALRALLVACPDGCGETLAMNLDPRMAKAWRLDLRGGVTLYPSVWRDSGCKSHFILWKDRIIWCDRFARGNSEPPYDATLEDRLGVLLDATTLRSAEELAASLDEIPWDVSRAAQALVRKGLAVAGQGALRDSYRRATIDRRA